jgi:hypothetical protein
MSTNILERLAAPIDPTRVSWRVGATTGDKTKGLALAYIDARDVMQRLDEVCGADGWQNDYPHANGKTVCRIGIKIGNEWIWKANGAGDTDVEAEKGALSDAFKRAAVMWGIGRYLYDVDFALGPDRADGQVLQDQGERKSAAANATWQACQTVRIAVKCCIG